MIVPFPFNVPIDLADEICCWVGENSSVAKLTEHADFVELTDEEVALYFRLRFGL